MLKATFNTRLLRTFFAIALLALVYLIVGRLSLLLAIPPGFATAIFPPVGISLAAVLIWGYPMLCGVFIGSTLLNVTISLSSFDAVTFSHLMVATGIALGTCLQCGVASLLIRRYVGYPNALVDEKVAFKTLCIGGPLSCLISASIGPIVLYMAGAVDALSLPYSIWTWWIGDSIGVLIALPLMFILFAEPKEIWRPRLPTVGVPLISASAIVVIIFFQTSHSEQSAQKLSFKEEANLIDLRLKFRFMQYEQVVSFMERYHISSKDLDRERFHYFATPILEDFPGIKSLTINEYLPHESRGIFEDGKEQRNIKVKAPDGSLEISPVQDFYAPIVLIEPYGSNSHLVGYDPLSDPTKKPTFISSMQSNGARISSLVELLQKPKQKGFILVKSISDESVKKEKLIGFAVAVINPNELIDYALTGLSGSDFSIEVLDVTEKYNRTLYQSIISKETDYSASFKFTSDFEFGGRKIRLVVSPSESYLRKNKSLQSWAVLAGGLVLTAMLGGFLLMLSGRAELVRQQVRRQTIELSAILENAADAIIIITENGIIEQANPAAKKLFKASRNELDNLDSVNLLPSLTFSDSGEVNTVLGDSTECLGLSLDGEKLELELGLSHYQVSGQNRYICVLRDISDRKKVERLKSEFVATVSHELRTPLTSIKGSLELIKAGIVGDISKECSQLIDISLKNSDKLESLVNDILDIEKLKSGNIGLDLSFYKIVPFLREAIDHSQGYADKFKVYLSLDISNTSPNIHVRVDKLRLHQVMANLLSNAIKFSPSGGLVKVLVEVDGDFVRVNVIDQGQGVSEDFKPQIFQRFAQADSSDRRQQGGTGLGLNICKTLIERMNGRIDFVSTHAQGSTFFIELPIAEVPS